MKLNILNIKFMICKLAPNSEIPKWINASNFYSITQTDEELSILCEQVDLPNEIEIEQERDWRAIKIEGPLEFSMTGVLSKMSSILANYEISIFAISTFDTDYILVKENKLSKAKEALIDNGYIF